MTRNTMHLSILTLNVSGLNAPIKRHKIANWVNKQDPTICSFQETHLTEKNKHWLRVKGWKKLFQENGLHKQAGEAILISDKVDIRLKSVRGDNEGHLILTKGIIHQEEISILNIYALMDLRAEINPNTVIVGDLNTPLAPIDRSSELLLTLDQMDIIDIYRVFCPTTVQYTFFL
jgi:hypothetical protein